MLFCRIKWNPAVLSFNFPSKQIRADDDPIAPHQYRLEPLDIKTVHEYIVGKTTHVVAARRNTTKGLEALINAKPIVTEGFIDAIATATTPIPNPADPSDPLPSSLEQDFDANWPDATPFLPPAGNEPIPRPPGAFNPRPERADVFGGLTFVFLSSDQFDALQAPITEGHGKALIYELNLGQTTVDQIVDYVTNVSGYKDINELQNTTQQKTGVVVVRLRPKGEWSNWMTNLQQRVDVKLGLRSVEQNEFLDAILQNNASPLRRPLEDDDRAEIETERGTTSEKVAKLPSMKASSSGIAEPEQEQGSTLENRSAAASPELKAPPSSASEQIEAEQPQQDTRHPSKPAPSATTRRRGRRGIITSRFIGFDDFGESHPTSKPPITENRELAQSPTPAPAKSTRSKVTITPASPSEPAVTQKRPLSPSPDPEAAVDDLLPGAAALKRRRLERGTPTPETSGKRKASDEIKEEPSSSKKPKTEVEDVDYNALLRSRREAEDEAAQRDQEALREALAIDGLTVEDMKGLVKVDTMEVPMRSRPSEGNGDGQEGRGPDNVRWDQRWNGRKNFKGFRRRGQDEEVQKRRQKVFVPMEEVKRKSFGLRGENWGNTPSEGRAGTESQSLTRKSRSQRQTQDEDEGDSNKYRRREGRSKNLGQEAEVGQPFQQSESEEVIRARQTEQVDQRAEERAGERGKISTQHDESIRHPTQTSRAETQTQKSKGKRPAREEIEPMPQPKRRSKLDSGQKAARQDDEGDGLKFKFRRRRQD
ncbi:MAG: hypothetical protein Q9157_000476 [Trypethelium eluteriae]